MGDYTEFLRIQSQFAQNKRRKKNKEHQKQNKRRQKRTQNEYTLAPLEAAGLYSPNVTKFDKDQPRDRRGRWTDGPGLRAVDHFTQDQEDQLHEDANDAFFGGVVPQDYHYFSDPGSHYYDPEDETPDDETNEFPWQGLGQWYASDEIWFSNFEGSRAIRRQANSMVGIDDDAADPLLGGREGNESRHEMQAFAMLHALNTSEPLDQPLMRGTYVDGVSADEVMRSLEGQDHIDLSLASFTNNQNVADYFASRKLYEINGEASSEVGTQIMFSVEPGAQGIIGRRFPDDIFNIDDDDEYNQLDDDELRQDLDPSRSREIVTGGRFAVVGIDRDGDVIRVRLNQQFTFSPVGGSDD